MESLDDSSHIDSDDRDEIQLDIDEDMPLPGLDHAPTSEQFENPY